MLEIMTSIDLTGVKKITIPEGVVKKISVDGIPVWEEAIDEVTYTPIDYIYFTGAQYFDTGLYCSQNTQIEIKFTRESSSSRWLYGIRSTNDTASVAAYLSSSGAWRFGNQKKNYTLSTGASNIHTMIINKTGCTYNGSNSKFTSTAPTFVTPHTLNLGVAKSANGAIETTAYFIGKLYSFKIYEGTTLVADYIPSISSEGEYGFYDNVTGNFMTSDTNTPFDNEAAALAIDTLDLNYEFNEIELTEEVLYNE